MCTDDLQKFDIGFELIRYNGGANFTDVKNVRSVLKTCTVLWYYDILSDILIKKHFFTKRINF